MYTYHIVSPDGITFRAPSFECAALATLLVTDGKFGAESPEGEPIPAFPEGGDGKWFKRTFGRRWMDALTERTDSGELGFTFRNFTIATDWADNPMELRAWRLARLLGGQEEAPGRS